MQKEMDWVAKNNGHRPTGVGEHKQIDTEGK